MAEGGRAEEAPLLQLEHCSSEPAIKIRTGTIWTAVAHIITAVIGSGVLSLAWSVAQLGWVAGPLAILFFASITLLSSFLLCDCYRSPHPKDGPGRNRSYVEAVHTSLGKNNAWVCGLLVQLSLYGIGIAYTITSAISIRSIQRSYCDQKETAYDTGDTLYMLLFGAAQIILSQIPDMHNIQWLSVVAAMMSFTYSFIGFALGFAQVLANGYVKGSIAGVPTRNTIDKVWNISQALGDIAFGYPFSAILIEIQDTLQSPPPETQTMKKSSVIAVVITTFFYLCCGGFGYAAFGDDTPGSILTRFELCEFYWLLHIANTCIVLHLAGSYQVISQPVFASIERWIAEKCPSSRLVNNSFTLKLPFLRAFELSILRLVFRTIYVLSTTAIAITFPYFNQVLGVLGGLNFWPLTIYFPVEMYFKQRKIEAWTIKWIMLRAFSIICFFATAFTLLGSIEGLVSARLGRASALIS